MENKSISQKWLEQAREDWATTAQNVASGGWYRAFIPFTKGEMALSGVKEPVGEQITKYLVRLAVASGWNMTTNKPPSNFSSDQAWRDYGALKYLNELAPEGWHFVIHRENVFFCHHEYMEKDEESGNTERYRAWKKAARTRLALEKKAEFINGLAELLTKTGATFGVGNKDGEDAIWVHLLPEDPSGPFVFTIPNSIDVETLKDLP